MKKKSFRETDILLRLGAFLKNISVFLRNCRNYILIILIYGFQTR